MKLGKRILVVTSDFPYPPNNGGRLDSWGNILQLKSIGAEIDLFCTVKSQPDREAVEHVKSVVNQLTIVLRSHGIISMIQMNPFQIESRKALRTIPLERQYDFVFMDSDYATPILDNPTLRANLTIQRIQNDEANFQLDMARATRSPFKKAFHLLDAARFAVYLPKARQRADWLFFISDHERAEFVKRHPDRTERSLFVPPSMDLSTARRRSLAGRRVLFIATLALPSNQAGLSWYLHNVHPQLLLVEGYDLLVAGNTLGQELGICEEATRTEKVTLIKDPVELEDLYDSGAVFINPVLHGAGLKLKTVNALLSGIPAVTTSVGAEGTGFVDGKHIEITDDAKEFAQRIRTLLHDKERAQGLVSNAQEYIAEKFNTAKIFRKIINGES